MKKLIVILLIIFTEISFAQKYSSKNASNKKSKIETTRFSYKINELNVNKLPAAVKKSIVKKYSKKIKYLIAYKILNGKKLQYKVRVLIKQDTREILLSKTGKIISSKKIIVYNDSEEEMGC